MVLPRVIVFIIPNSNYWSVPIDLFKPIKFTAIWLKLTVCFKHLFYITFILIVSNSNMSIIIVMVVAYHVSFFFFNSHFFRSPG